MLVDDHNIIMHGLKQSLSQEKDITVVAEASSGRSAIERVPECNPDIIIMDVSMPDLNGIEATRKILKINPGIKIIGLSMHAEKQFVLSMLNAGARGYVLKNNFFNELLTAIRAVISGDVFLSSELAEHIVKPVIHRNDKKETCAYSTLSSREREVLQLIAEGKTISYIAEHLFISKKTVASHRMNIMKKLKLNNIPALTKFALQQGITSLDM
jgi:DNA-binding NarL/FixJ family response regulator